MTTLTMSKTQARMVETIGQTVERHGAPMGLVEGVATWLYGDTGVRWAEGTMTTADLRRLNRVLEQYLTGVYSDCAVHASSLRKGRYGYYCPTRIAHRLRDGSLTTRYCKGGLEGLAAHLEGRGGSIPRAVASDGRLVERAQDQQAARREAAYMESTRRLEIANIDLDREVTVINLNRYHGDAEYTAKLCYCPCTPGPHIGSETVWGKPGGGNWGFHGSDIQHSQCKPLSAEARRLYDELRLLERRSILMIELMNHLPYWPREQVMNGLLPELSKIGLVGIRYVW